MRRSRALSCLILCTFAAALRALLAPADQPVDACFAMRFQ